MIEERLTILLAKLLDRVERPQRQAATVLVYHAVQQQEGELLVDSVPLEQFERQMRCLREERYAPVPLESLIESVSTGGEIPERSVAVTFDDGYLDTCTHALPILQRWQIPATVFLAAGYIGSGETFPWLRDRGAASLPMGWREVRELRRAGVAIGSHTFTHRFLPHLHEDELMLELARSKEVIEAELGAPVTSLSLPFSFPVRHPKWPSFQERLNGALRQLGYRSCCTMERGHLRAGDDPFALKRIAVGRSDDLSLFRAKLAGCFSWTAPMQSLYQRYLKSYPVTEYGNLG